MKRLFWIGLILCFSPEIYSQLSLGLVNGNYSGSTGIIMNPSSMANTKLRSDIHLFSLHAFAENNYLYFPSRESSFVKLINGAYDYHFFPKPYGNGDRKVYSYYQDKSLKNIFVNARIIGPSVMLSFHDQVFAISTGFRVMSSTRRLPYDMANFSYYGMDFSPQHNINFSHDDYDMASMAWWEVKISYATVIKRSRNNYWSGGISVGPAFGYSGVYMLGGDTRYIAYNDSILNVELLNGEFGLSIPLDYQSDVVDFFNPIVRGYGWGMDLGITWQYREKPYQKRIPRNCYKKRFEDYKFKIGVSLLDIGWINFTKNTEKHSFDNVHNNHINVNVLEYDNIRAELNSTSEMFYGDPDASLRGNSIKIYMPATVCVQFDYHLRDWWYLNSVIIIPAKYTSPMIERPFIVALTPRFESKFLEINVPLVLYDFRYPRIGLSIRLDGLTIGTDHFGSLLNKRDFTGADIYVSYKINLRSDGKNPFSSRGACYNNWRRDLQKIRQSDF